MMRYILIIALLLSVSYSAHAEMQDRPSVKLQALDKSTARKTTLDVKVGDTIEYGSLFIKVQACRESDPLDKPESAAFLQIWEVPLNAKKSEWVFSGWMFASSPALSAMDHAVYDVWVLSCTGGPKPAKIEPSTTVEIEPNDEFDETPNEIDENSIDEDNSVIEDNTQNLEEEPLEENSDIEAVQEEEKSIDSVLDEAINEDVINNY